MISKRLCILVLTIFLTLVLSISPSSPAQDPETPQAPEEIFKLGEITLFSGEVLVRTKGSWDKLSSVPYTVYNTDKVVTRRGRAEITFIDGGVLRLDVDSNLSIVEREETGGFMVKRKMTARQVSVLLGQVWFDIHVEKEKMIRFRTPTMTAGIRGTSGKIQVGVKGETRYGLATGRAETKGDYNPISHPEPINQSQVSTLNLPASDPDFDRSKLQQSAIEAVNTFHQASQTEARAAELDKMALLAAEQAQKSGSRIDRLQAEAARAGALAAQSQARAVKAAAHFITQKDKLVEAERFNEPEEVSITAELADQAERVLNESKKAAALDRQLADDTQKTLNEALKTEEQQEKNKEEKGKEGKEKEGKIEHQETKKPFIDEVNPVKKTPMPVKNHAPIIKEKPEPKDEAPKVIDKTDQSQKEEVQPEEQEPQGKKDIPPAVNQKKEASGFSQRIKQLRRKVTELWKRLIDWVKNLFG